MLDKNIENGLSYKDKAVVLKECDGQKQEEMCIRDRAKIIAGILKPTSGKILLDGEDITDLSLSLIHIYSVLKCLHQYWSDRVTA